MIAGWHHGYFWDDEETVVKQIADSGATIFFVAIASPNLDYSINRRDDRVDPLFATDSEEGGRSHAYGRPARDSVRTKEQARAWQYL